MTSPLPAGTETPLAHSDIQCGTCLRYFRFEGDLDAHAATHPLDPEPYSSTAPDFERYSDPYDYEGRHGVVFDPRPGYSQNREDYR